MPGLPCPRSSHHHTPSSPRPTGRESAALQNCPTLSGSRQSTTTADTRKATAAEDSNPPWSLAEHRATNPSTRVDGVARARRDIGRSAQVRGESTLRWPSVGECHLSDAERVEHDEGGIRPPMLLRAIGETPMAGRHRDPSGRMRAGDSPLNILPAITRVLQPAGHVAERLAHLDASPG